MIGYSIHRHHAVMWSCGLQWTMNAEKKNGHVTVNATVNFDKCWSVNCDTNSITRL